MRVVDKLRVNHAPVDANLLCPFNDTDIDSTENAEIWLCSKLTSPGNPDSYALYVALSFIDAEDLSQILTVENSSPIA